jgi:outer membrane protein TolC
MSFEQMKLRLVLVFGFLATCASTGFGATVSLEQAIRSAVANSPEVQARARELEARTLELRSAEAGFYPALNFETVNGWSHTEPSATGSDTVGRMRLALEGTLFDNGLDQSRIAKARLALERARLQLDEERNKVTLAVVVAFLDYSLASSEQAIQREQHDLYLQQHKLINNLYRQGVRRSRDFIRIEAGVKGSELQLLGTDTAFKKSESELRRVLAEPLVPSEGKEPLNLQAADLTQMEGVTVPAAAPALETQLLWKMTDLDRRIEEETVYAARREVGPRLYVTTGIGRYANNYWDQASANVQGPVQGWDWNALATLKWSLWDWGVRDRAVEIARAGKDARLARLDSDLLTRRSEIENMMLDLRKAGEEVRLSNEVLRLQRESLKITQSDYRNGQADFTDLILSISNLASARSSQARAIANLRKALARYQYFQGTIYGNYSGQ